MSFRLGVLLPHFGPASNWERVFGLAPRLEELGYSSVYFRDQLGYSGGVVFDQRSNHFVDPFIGMSAIAATTELTVGTATLTPVRKPVVLAQMVASLVYLAHGRVSLGVGLGGQPRAFELARLSMKDRVELFEEMVAVLRKTAHPHADHHGIQASFEDLTLDPAPPSDLELLYCGSSVAAIRRAVSFTNGWFPGRCPIRVFDRLNSRLREEADRAGVSMRVAIVPLVSIDRTREAALSKVNVAGILEESVRRGAWRPDGPFESADDLRGALIAGDVDDVLAGLGELAERGVDEVVVDLRERMDAFEEAIETIGSEVIPKL